VVAGDGHGHHAYALQAYQTDTETFVTVSQLLPVPTVEEFTVVPRSNVQAAAQYSDAPLSASEFQELALVLTNEGMRGALDLLSSRPGEWLTYAEIVEYTGKSRAQLRASLGALTRLVRKRFGKNSAPFEAPWRPDLNDYGFRMDAEQAAWWKQATASDGATSLPEAPPPGHDEAAMEGPEL
jgi:hypothetical protein